ncbi:MAG: hypothetical protein RH982_17035 [Parvibaculum sp.]
MKKAFAFAGLAAALLAVAAAAQTYMRAGGTAGTGPATLVSAATASPAGRQGTGDDDDDRVHRGRVVPLAEAVRELELKTSATVTEIRLSRDRRFYEFEGVTQRGFLVTAKASAASGAVGGIAVESYKPRYDARATSISPLLASFREQGYHSFDFASLKEEEGVYQLRGLDDQGDPVMIRAAARSGKVLSTRKMLDARR